MKKSDNIIVSIAIRAYKSERYIMDCLEAIEKQNFNHSEMEIVISTDCSPDNTNKLINEFSKKSDIYVNDVTLDKNLGGYENLFYLFTMCRGKYIAICDADDYWLDSNKLIKQIDFLENNNEYSACFHNAAILNENNSNRVYDENVKNKDYSANSIVRKWIIPTSSFVFRRELSQFFPPKNNFYYDDIVVFLTMASKGKLRGFEDCMSVYRKTSSGWTSSMKKDNNIYNKIYQHYMQISTTFPDVSKLIIVRKIIINELCKIKSRL